MTRDRSVDILQIPKAVERVSGEWSYMVTVLAGRDSGSFACDTFDDLVALLRKTLGEPEVRP